MRARSEIQAAVDAVRSQANDLLAAGDTLQGEHWHQAMDVLEKNLGLGERWDERTDTGD